MKNETKITAMSLAALCAIICFELLGEIRGYKRGYDYAIGLEPSIDSGINFTSHGPNIFEVICNAYLVLGILFLVYFLSYSLKNKVWSRTLAYFSLAGASLQLFRLLKFKMDILDLPVVVPNNNYEWLNSSIALDWFCASVTLALIIGHIVGGAAFRHTDRMH